ncbi:MAG TPA: type II/IV secretion system protein [Dehalococcoidia bacterium]|nr:type II/IV secretion system protein [Dehalococcoidia bacterium]
MALNNFQSREYVDLNTYAMQPEALHLIPVSIATRHLVIPLAIEEGTLLVAMADINNIQAIQEIAAVSKKRVVPVPAEPTQIRQAIDYNYKSYDEVEKQLSKMAPVRIVEEEFTQDISDAPVVRALDMIMNEAVKARASDIHVEPQVNRLRVRFRIDGVLHETMSLPLSAQAALISRIKIMARMNIADSRPQDGQLSLRVRNQDIDMRVATINTIYGEMGTLRILDKSLAARNLPELGFSSDTLEQYQRMLKSPQGMILICGPTGSGKTTTLYASINSLDRQERKIITIEDPVEYRFTDIDQTQVNPKAGLTFASGVRSFMRHDPDVIMIGEVRDADTVSIATQAALTGQLVLSSVHASDAAGSISRLLDLGTSPYMISSTLVCVVAQRMVRRVCPHCRQLTEETPEASLAFSNETGEEKKEFYIGKGCNACGQTGFLGRTVISEIMVMSHNLRSAILKGRSTDEIRDIAIKTGMVTMWRDGMFKAKDGITTPSEVLRNIMFTG